MPKIFRWRHKSTARAICGLTAHFLKILHPGRSCDKVELQMVRITLCRWLRSKSNSSIYSNGHGANSSLDLKARPQAVPNMALGEKRDRKQVRLDLMAIRQEILQALCQRRNCRSTHLRISYLRPRSRIAAFCILVLRRIILVVALCDTNLPSHRIYLLPMLLSTIQPQIPL